MTRKKSRYLLTVGLVGAAALLLAVASGCTREVIKEVPKEVIKEVIKEVPKEVIKEVIKEVPKEVTREVIKEVPKEVPLSLTVAADRIQKGQIDVGKAYGMAPDQRYHKIHETVVGPKCEVCHTQKADSYNDPLAQVFFQADRRACLSCHAEGGPRPLYGENWEKAKIAR